MSKLSALLADFAETTSLHGFADLKNARTACEKLFWVFLLISCLCLALWTGRFVIIGYYDMEVNVKNKDPPQNEDYSNYNLTYCHQTWLNLDKFDFVNDKDAVDKYNTVLYAASLIPSSDLDMVPYATDYFGENSGKTMVPFGGYLIPGVNQLQTTHKQLWDNLRKFAKNKTLVEFLSDYAHRVDSPPWSHHAGWTVQFGKLCQILRPAKTMAVNKTADQFEVLAVLPDAEIEARKVSFNFHSNSLPFSHVSSFGGMTGMLSEIGNKSKLSDDEHMFWVRKSVYEIKYHAYQSIKECADGDDSTTRPLDFQINKCLQHCLQQQSFNKGDCILRNNFDSNEFFTSKRACSISYIEDQNIRQQMLGNLDQNEMLFKSIAEVEELSCGNNYSQLEFISNHCSEKAQLFQNKQFLKEMDACSRIAECANSTTCHTTDYVLKDLTNSYDSTEFVQLIVSSGVLSSGALLNFILCNY